MPEEPTIDFGTYLRQAREKRGISLQQVSATTKISVRVLDALERNDPRKLPGGIFSRAFVRSYAREVGLDPEAVVTQFVAAFPNESGTEDLPVQTTSEDAQAFESHRRAATTLLQLVGICLVIVVIVMFYVNLRPRSASPAPAAAEPAAVKPPAAPTSVPDAPPPSAVTPAADPATSQAAPPAPAPVPPASEAPLVVGIAARASCWLSVTVDGTQVLARIVEPGETLEYKARASVTLSAGNAGGLVWTLNGKPAKPLGNSGQVVSATITVDRLKDFLQYP